MLMCINHDNYEWIDGGELILELCKKKTEKHEKIFLEDLRTSIKKSDIFFRIEIAEEYVEAELNQIIRACLATLSTKFKLEVKINSENIYIIDYNNRITYEIYVRK